MTKEDFISLGLKEGFHYGQQLRFDWGNVWEDDGRGAFFNYNSITNNLKIDTTDKGYNRDGPNYSTKFNGFVTSIEEFKLILNLIKLRL